MVQSEIQRAPLGFRARRILYAVITEYVSSGEPVGSRTLSRRYGLELSSASIRNVLSDLEEAGYLVQPHTSAGRIPTDLGFRVFVDALVQMQEVQAEDKARIVERLSSLRSREEVWREGGKILASLANTATLVRPPRAEEEKLMQLRFVPLKEKQVLAVLVTRSGAVQNRVVELLRKLESMELEEVHNYLTPLIEGRSLSEVREELKQRVDQEQDRYQVLRKRATEVVDAAMASAEEQGQILIEGQGLLFDQPEFANAEKIKAFVRAFEAKQDLLDLLDRTLTAGGVQILIGAEANLAEVQDISLVSAQYSAVGGSGSLAVVGPARLDYGKVVPLVTYTAQIMEQMLERQAPKKE